MNMGIDGGMMNALWIVLLSIIGAVGFYLYHKVTGKGIKTWTLKSVAVYAVMGGIAGLILVYVTKGGQAIGNYDIIPIALAWGAAWQNIIGKFLGWKAESAAKKPAEPVVEKKDEKKAEEPKKEEKKDDNTKWPELDRKARTE